MKKLFGRLFSDWKLTLIGLGLLALAITVPLARNSGEPSVRSDKRTTVVQLCQHRLYQGVDCQDCPPHAGEQKWSDSRPIPLDIFSQGEYLGPARIPHLPVYRVRVGDSLEFTYRLTREELQKPYEFNVGDTLKVESLADRDLDRELVVQPDGNITLRLLGQVRAVRRSVEEVKKAVEESYKKYYPEPAITVTPLKMETRLEDLRAAVDGRFGAGGQRTQVVVSPDGTIQLPAIGTIPAQNLTLSELKYEVDERYAQIVAGIELQPRLVENAPTSVFVVGEVRNPGRYDMGGPTTVMGAIALAGGWENGGNLREVVIFRRAEDWRLIATKLDIRGALIGKRPCPADEIWLRNSDIVVVPKSNILLMDDFIDLVFTRGIYGVVPNQGISVNFSKLGTL